MTACIAEHCDRDLRQPELDAGQWICLPCLRLIRSWLAELPAQMTVLRGSMQRETVGSPVRSGTRTPPTPGRIDTLNLIGPSAPGDIHDPHGDQHGTLPVTAVLDAWVRICCEELRLDPPIPATEEQLAAWLDQRLAWAAKQPWAGEMRGELDSMIRHVRRITHVRPGRRPLRRPCPRCTGLDLVETDWQSYIECEACGSLWTQAELEADAARRAHTAAA